MNGFTTFMNKKLEHNKQPNSVNRPKVVIYLNFKIRN